VSELRQRLPSFAALRHRGYGGFILGNATAMLADNTEHVISYWVIAQKFHSPALGGFAVISHWLPFLLLSGYAGTLAQRFNPRRMIQLGMVLFMLVSLGWGMLFRYGNLAIWQACLLLIIHGIAGVLWTPTSQLLIHEIVGPEHLQSAVRLAATSRYMGTLTGPALGSLLLNWLGPAHGIFLNALIYLPMLWWLQRRRYVPVVAGSVPAAPRVMGLGALLGGWRSFRGHRPIIAMTALGAAAAFFVGSAYQAQMPGFAESLGHGNPGLAYSALLAADAAGALSAGVFLELLSLLPATVRGALLLAMGWCLCLACFALTASYPLALLMLFGAGFCELSFNAMAQTLVQLHAPPTQRGRIIGLFNTASMGLRTVSGISVGVGGALLGIHASLALSATAVLLCVALINRWYGASDAGP